MSELLIELLSEEIPSNMQKNTEYSYSDIFTKHLQENEIKYSTINTYSGTRRITICIDGIEDIIPSKTVEIKGPKLNAPPIAIDKFCESHQIDKLSLQVQKIKDQEYYVFIKKQQEQKTENLLLNLIPNSISEYVWPKSMYWGDYKIKWVRPLINILCVYNNKVLPIIYGHLQGNNYTYGHRFLGNKKIKVDNFQDYHEKLKANNIVLSRFERSDQIRQGLREQAKKLNLELKYDLELLEEVAGLVEHPKVLVGKIDDKFLNLPSEILVESMRLHQKYFNLFDKNSKFAPYFLFVTNVNPNENDAVEIIKGNERVLSARLEDALYFYNQDIKTTLESRRKALKQVVFHAKLGSIKEKTDRLASICNYLSPDDADLKKAAMLCKSDILSEAVGEFPKLQGIMGYYYAKHEGMNDNIAIAIRDHYKPLASRDEIPKSNIASILALSDKLDSLCGLMIAGERATGSKDPYALRRTALGIIRIMIAYDLHIDLRDLVQFCVNQYKLTDKCDIQNEIMNFIEGRLKFHLKEMNGAEFVDAVLDLYHYPNIYQTYSKILALGDFCKTKNAKNVITSYKRAYNILQKSNYSGKLNPDLFESKYEKDLYHHIITKESQIMTAIYGNDYAYCFETFGAMESVIGNFFDHVMVCVENKEIANNRLLLLSKVTELFSKVAKFEKIT